MRLVSDFGAASLFFILAVNCLGVPFPTSLIMLAIGALAAQGEISLVPFLVNGIAGAVAGDQLGYGVGRLGSSAISRSVAVRTKLGVVMKRARDFETKWGDMGIFLSRWLLSPMGPYVNIVAGMTAYSWPRFTLWGGRGRSALGIHLHWPRSLLWSKHPDARRPFGEPNLDAGSRHFRGFARMEALRGLTPVPSDLGAGCLSR